eukprot:418950_1
MGFDSNYILRAFKVYENKYGYQVVYDVEVITEIIYRLQQKDIGNRKRQLKSNNKRFHSVVAPSLNPFISHMTSEDAHNLSVGDCIDHRDRFGRFRYAEIVGKNGTNVQILYYGHTPPWININHNTNYTWCDFTLQLHRFAYPRSISFRRAHRWTTLTERD